MDGTTNLNEIIWLNIDKITDYLSGYYTYSNRFRDIMSDINNFQIYKTNFLEKTIAKFNDIKTDFFKDENQTGYDLILEKIKHITTTFINKLSKSSYQTTALQKILEKFEKVSNDYNNWDDQTFSKLVKTRSMIQTKIDEYKSRYQETQKKYEKIWVLKSFDNAAIDLKDSYDLVNTSRVLDQSNPTSKANGIYTFQNKEDLSLKKELNADIPKKMPKNNPANSEKTNNLRFYRNIFDKDSSLDYSNLPLNYDRRQFSPNPSKTFNTLSNLNRGDHNQNHDDKLHVLKDQLVSDYARYKEIIHESSYTNYKLRLINQGIETVYSQLSNYDYQYSEDQDDFQDVFFKRSNYNETRKVSSKSGFHYWLVWAKKEKKLFENDSGVLDEAGLKKSFINESLIKQQWQVPRNLLKQIDSLTQYIILKDNSHTIRKDSHNVFENQDFFNTNTSKTAQNLPYKKYSMESDEVCDENTDHYLYWSLNKEDIKFQKSFAITKNSHSGNQLKTSPTNFSENAPSNFFS